MRGEKEGATGGMATTPPIVDGAVHWAFTRLGLQPDGALPDPKVVFAIAHDDGSREAACARDVVCAVVRGARVMDPKHTPLPTAEDSTAATPFQRLLVYVLGKLAEYGMRRRNDACYHQLQVDGGPAAWVRSGTVREFILQHTRKDVAPEYWRYLTTSRENLDVLCRHLLDSDDGYVEFPTLCVDSGLISWANGVYSLEDNVFWTTACSERWVDLAETAQRERRVQGWGETYVLHPPDVVHTAACHHVAETFRVAAHGDDDRLNGVRDALRAVGIGAELHWWFFALLGRALFPLNKHERWHVVPFVKTSDGLDQACAAVFSTLFAKLLGTTEVVTLASGTSPLHAPEAIMHARVAMLLMRDAPPMEQGDWQSATCGEVMCITPRGGRTAFSRPWRTHLFSVGSRMPFKNDAGTVERRVVMFDASAAGEADVAALHQACAADADLLVQLCVDNYLTAVHRYGDHSLWDVLPAQFAKQREALREIADPLHTCLRSELFQHKPELYMPLSDFKDIYQGYRRNRGLQAQRWIRDHWHATFAELNLSIERSQRDYRGTKSTTEWIIGLDCVESTDRSAVITSELLEQLHADTLACRSELNRVTARYDAAAALKKIEDQISDLKQARANFRNLYRKHSTAPPE